MRQERGSTRKDASEVAPDAQHIAPQEEEKMGVIESGLERCGGIYRYCPRMIATGYGGDVVGYYGDEFENDESDDEKTRNR